MKTLRTKKQANLPLTFSKESSKTVPRKLTDRANQRLLRINITQGDYQLKPSASRIAAMKDNVLVVHNAGHNIVNILNAQYKSVFISKMPFLPT